jgi:hypothetical protein
MLLSRLGVHIVTTRDFGEYERYYKMTKEQLLVEVEDLLRTTPPRATIRHPLEENFSWLGRASVVLEQWNPATQTRLTEALDKLQGLDARAALQAFSRLQMLLHQAGHDLRLQTIGPVNLALSRGMVFNYFDEVRKIIEIAKEDLFFIDPYLDAEFISRYLPHMTTGTTARLLAREKLLTLIPAVDAFVKQSNAKVEVRSSPNFHDRYVIVDRVACYQSGASFKDGAKAAPTTLTQITDAFPAVLSTYEKLWSQAKIER